MSTITNIDALCARHGWQMTDKANKILNKPADTENLITQSLAVLQEQGVYAFFLFLDSRKGKQIKAAPELTNVATAALKEMGIAPFAAANTPDALGAVRTLANNLDDLLLAKRVLEQTLIYASYHAKALGVTSA